MEFETQLQKIAKLSNPKQFKVEIGSHIDGYRVNALLGEGAYGIVYKVIDPATHLPLALKVLKLWRIENPDTQKMICKRFVGEFKCGQLNDPYLVKSIDMGLIADNPYILLEFMENGDLRKKVPFFRSIEAINKLAVEVLNGLQVLHNHGIIHRDLKPENVMLDRELSARLSDFGIAGFINSRITVPNFAGKVKETFGTYAYIAPEQLKDHQKFNSTGPKTDIFSFGAMFYELLSGGKHPFGPLYDQKDLVTYIKNLIAGSIAPIKSYYPDLPQYWVSILEGALATNFDHRFSTVNQILQLLPHAHSNTAPIAQTAFKTAVPQSSESLALIITQGEQTGRSYNLEELFYQNGNVLTIGWFDAQRPMKNHIELVEAATAYVSNYHATMELIEEQYLVIKDGQYRTKSGVENWWPSTNGTYVNGEKTNANGIELDLGDMITIGDMQLQIRYINFEDS